MTVYVRPLLENPLDSHEASSPYNSAWKPTA